MRYPAYRLLKTALAGTPVVTVLAFLTPAVVLGQGKLLDDFESLDGWKAIASEGVHLAITPEQGKTGKALGMRFDLSGSSGYVIAQKDLSLDLPPDYQFTFDMRADAPMNNFEFKVMDEFDNVWWIKKLNITYPTAWTHERIKKRHLTFAWGPKRDARLTAVRKIEFVVSAGTGGSGVVYIDNFRFEPIDDQEVLTSRATVSVSSSRPGGKPAIDPAATLAKHWCAPETRTQQLTVNFGCLKEVGGLAIDWDSLDYATAYEVLFSDDGREWTRSFRATAGNGGRDYVYLPEGEGRHLRITVHKTSRGKGVGIRQIAFKPPQFSSSPNDFFRAIAAESPEGRFPKYCLNKQSYWTVLGVDGDSKEALINEQGQVEVDKLQFSLEPFLYIDGRLITWNEVTTTPSLLADFLPIPKVTWNFKDQWELAIEPCATGKSGESVLYIRYALTAKTAIGNAKLFVALRPFQVNPPWQFLNIQGGTARVDSVAMRDGVIRINTRTVIPLSKPSAFGAATFESGEIVEHLAHGTLPASGTVCDPLGFASGALAYDLTLAPGETREVVVAVPFHSWQGTPEPNLPSQEAHQLFTAYRDHEADVWSAKLKNSRIDVPEAARPVINTLYSNLAYIFVNRDGPGIQPGSRSYERSWIRDGALTCTALLQTGHAPEVKQFLDWYAKGQFPSGKIPCVIDSRGPDPVPEHDSHGEFIYALLQYFLYSHDTLWLQSKYEAVAKAVRYIELLRKERMTETYRNGTPEQRALYGILPESISHEGYSDFPRHSYWDDFFALRGLKDATTIATVLGRAADASEFGAERDDFRKDLYASMRLAMQNTKINYIPGCAELGDFDATSTTVGIAPGGELGNIPEPQLHNTFDKYYAYFQDRRTQEVGPNYTPYETRIIGSFVYLGQRDRAEEALNFFMNDRRPPAWNHWAEVVWRDPATPKFIGDMPHTWVGSDFVRSVRAMFVYERERDTALVISAGIPRSWLKDSNGVTVEALPTYYGPLSYSIKPQGQGFVIDIQEGVRVPRGGIVFPSPMTEGPKRVLVNGKPAVLNHLGEVVIQVVPAQVRMEY
jgi:hypothetical protein